MQEWRVAPERSRSPIRSDRPAASSNRAAEPVECVQARYGPRKSRRGQPPAGGFQRGTVSARSSEHPATGPTRERRPLRQGETLSGRVRDPKATW